MLLVNSFIRLGRLSVTHRYIHIFIFSSLFIPDSVATPTNIDCISLCSPAHSLCETPPAHVCKCKSVQLAAGCITAVLFGATTEEWERKMSRVVTSGNDTVGISSIGAKRQNIPLMGFRTCSFSRRRDTWCLYFIYTNIKDAWRSEANKNANRGSGRRNSDGKATRLRCRNDARVPPKEAKRWTNEEPRCR